MPSAPTHASTRFAALAAAAAALAAIVAGPSCSGPEAGDVKEIERAVSFLTSPSIEGRAAGTPGGTRAAEFVAARLEAAGWLPAGDDGGNGPTFFQAVPAVRATLDAERCVLEASGAGGGTLRLEGSEGAGGETRATLTLDVEGKSILEKRDPSAAAAAFGGAKGFILLPDRADPAEVEGALVFAGFGIRDSERGRDDYDGLEVRGAVVLVFSGEPGETDPDSPWNGARLTRHGVVATKARVAEAAGAKALLVVPNPAGRADDAAGLVGDRVEEVGRPWIGPGGGAPGIPVAYLDPKAARWVLDGTGLELDEASARAERGAIVSRGFAGRAVRLEIAVSGREDLTLRNVVARLGAGDGLDGEVVVVGAHWDGLGVRGGALHPGADDNASGVAALLAAARDLARDRPGGRREILAAAWTAEEAGRLGSLRFTETPPVPLDAIAAAVNLDMTGRDNLDRDDYRDAIQLIYSGGAPVLRDLAARANGRARFDLRYYAALRFQPISDHWSFDRAGVPVVYPFSGYHADYHAPGDTPDKVSIERIGRTARYVADLARALADHPEPIGLDPQIREVPEPDPFDRPW